MACSVSTQDQHNLKGFRLILQFERILQGFRGFSNNSLGDAALMLILHDNLRLEMVCARREIMGSRLDHNTLRLCSKSACALLVLW